MDAANLSAAQLQARDLKKGLQQRIKRLCRSSLRDR
jgi:hypothetical protein